MSAVSIDGVSRRFSGVAAVEDLSLEVADGEFVTLLGPSGCGKTTTLRMVAGLEQNDTGRIRIAGRIVSDAGAGLFVPPDRRGLGMVFQSYAIWPHMTVFENVAYPLRVRRLAAAEIERKVIAALDLVEMGAYAARPAPALSGGQQQRVAIARALVFEPAVLLLDEPLSNLDARLRAQMGDEFRSLQRRLGITTLYVTHDQEEAMALSDRIVVMHAGRVLQAGSPEAIYQRPDGPSVARFFGSPNLVAARVAACTASAGDYRLQVDGEGWRGGCLAAEPFAPGDRIVMLVRPENVTLDGTTGAVDAAGSDGGIRWQGRVSHCVFRGARRTLTVATSHGPIHVDAPALRAAAVGDDVSLAVRPTAAWAMRDSSIPVSAGDAT